MNDWPVASRKRQLLGVYVDFLLVGAPLGILAGILARVLPGFDELPLWASLLFFASLEYFLLARLYWSPGMWALGIEPLRRSAVAIPDDIAMEKRSWRVDPDVLARGRWWTIAFGVVAVLSGAQAMTRWTTWGQPMPLFGFEVAPEISIAHSILLGAAEIAVGIAALRLLPVALPLGLAVYGYELALLVTSWSQLPELAAREIVARRAYQGFPLRPGEVEGAREMIQPMAAGGIAILLFAATMVGLRARSAPERIGGRPAESQP